MRTEEDIKNAVEVLRRGGVILYPTDTVWGIGCDATNAEAVRRVYDIKQRDDSKALICLVDSDARLQRYVRQVPDVAWQLIDSLKDSGAADDHHPGRRGQPGSEPDSRRRVDSPAHHRRALLARAVLPVPAGAGLHVGEHQRRACRPELLRHRPAHCRVCRLCLLVAPSGAQASHAQQHHPPASERRGDHHPQVVSRGEWLRSSPFIYIIRCKTFPPGFSPLRARESPSGIFFVAAGRGLLG